MYTFLLIVQVALAVALIVLILLQQGKGADAGAAFGSGASATVFGARGAGNFLSRTSAILATLFFANSLLLSTPLIIGDRKGPASVTEQVPPAPDAGTTTDTKAPADLPDAPAAPMQQSTPSDLPNVPAAPAPKTDKAPGAPDAPQEKSKP
ncbi:MAG: preprotein translocase subunit SecG [Gammaproteobacteria bacterium]|nr:preprotein translocase subunit SecG [Gammaproteobacteria bacterium]